MKTTSLGQVILSEQDIFRGLYSGKITDLDSINIDNPVLIDQFNQARKQNADPVADLQLFEETVNSIEQFDHINQENWFMDDFYKNMDIAKWLVEQCSSPEELDRVGEELVLFVQHDMLDVLKYLKYLVDTMRQNNLVWGVGRGSSVASYCLYLLGVHKVNSIKYGLDIHEFLK